jgi:hypothetical protein
MMEKLKQHTEYTTEAADRHFCILYMELDF